jgi:hypothetical protein
LGEKRKEREGEVMGTLVERAGLRRSTRGAREGKWEVEMETETEAGLK